MTKKIIINKHILVQKHLKTSEKEKEELLTKYNISVNELPKIRKSDPAIAKLNIKPGDVIKIIRKSPTANESFFYRCVTNV